MSCEVLEKISSFRATSIIGTKPIYGIVGGIDQTLVHSDPDFSIVAGIGVITTQPRLVRISHPQRTGSCFDISAVKVINPKGNFYYQAANFVRDF